jgi:hypothetical protein
MAVTPTRLPADVLGQARALRAALEDLAGALSRGDAPRVLAAEPALQAALAAVDPAGVGTREDRDAAAIELAAARAALARCRAIGAANAELTGVTLDVLGRTGSYSRHGAGQPRGPRGRDLHARV